MTKNIASTLSLRLVVPLLIGAAITPSMGCLVGDSISDETFDTVGITFEEFKAQTHQEPQSGIYIVDGDTPLDNERELLDFYVQHVQQGALAVLTSNGVDVKWSDTQKLNITYCVSTSFSGNYTTVVTAMHNAAAAWEAAANVNFVYASANDGTCTASNSNVVFDVQPTSGQPYLARAFFPNSPRASRNVLIDSSSFGSISPWTLTGILRHELGHALGFRHEHTRPEAGTCFENSNWRGLTTYDAASVMHYPQCNGSQIGDLVLTQKDKDGAASLYGAPSNFGTAVASFAGTLDMANLDGTGHFLVAVADVTGDGRADLVSADTGGTAFVWPGQSNGSFGAAVSSFAGTLDMANLDGSGHFLVAVADVTGDGQADLVSAHTSGSAYVWPGQ